LVWIITLVLLGIFLWLGNLRVLVIARDWPLILVLIGLVNLYKLFTGNKRKKIIRDLEKGTITVKEAEEKLIKNR